MKHGTSRRDFVKTAVAASVAGATLPAQAAIPAGDAAPSSAHASNQVHAAEPIAFPRIYTGRNLARISCPLGGIGAGGIGLGGRGNLQDWQIFNRPDIGNTPQFCFPASGSGRGARLHSVQFWSAVSSPLTTPEPTASDPAAFPACPAWPRPISTALSRSPASTSKIPTAQSKSLSKPFRPFSPSTPTPPAFPAPFSTTPSAIPHPSQPKPS